MNVDRLVYIIAAISVLSRNNAQGIGTSHSLWNIGHRLEVDGNGLFYAQPYFIDPLPDESPHPSSSLAQPSPAASPQPPSPDSAT